MPSKGGPRNNSGRKPKLPRDIILDAGKVGLTPLEYMLAVMDDPAVPVDRRDRMAIYAAPYCHAKADSAPLGKKEQKQAIADEASMSGLYAVPAGPKLAVNNG